MATTEQELKSLLEIEPMGDFQPYCEYSKEADAITVYFKSDRDYLKRLTDHVTLYLSADTNEIIGCRLKGVSGILEDLSNYVTVNHGGVELSLLFLSYRGIPDEGTRQAFNELVKKAGKMVLQES